MTPPAAAASPSATRTDLQRWTLCEPGLSFRDLDATPPLRIAGARLAPPAPSAPREPHLEVVPMPPAPGSFAMVMSGLLAFGAYHTTRVLPRLNVAPAPDWYCAGATPVGHATPLHLGDLLGTADLAPCFTAPSPLTVNSFERVALDRIVIPKRDVIPTRAPRSPPAANLSA